jgi:adenosine deaminase
MQTVPALERVTYELCLDLAKDNVRYAEIRFGPWLHVQRGLSLAEIIRATLEGWRAGQAKTGLIGGIIVTALRDMPPAQNVALAQVAGRFVNEGVVGFDVAGPEAGYPPTRYLDAFNLIHQANFHVTIHAGEAFGLPSIWEALQWCGAHRLGHGVRIVDDISLGDDGQVTMGRLATYVRDQRVPLEMCPTSNVHTGAVASIEEHPIDLLRRLRFRVTVNTDNRLMSGVTMSSEFETLSRVFDFGLDEMQWLTLNAMKSAFAPFDERLRLINGVIKPAYARLIAESNFAEAAARY